MRRRNLIVTSDSDEEDGDGTATTASASASVASGGGGGSSSAGRPSNPSPLPVHFPSLSLSPSVSVLVSDDDEEDVEEIQDPDGDSPFVDASEDVSPPAPAPPLPPPAAGTPAPTRTPTPTPPPAAHPRSTPPPSSMSGRLRPVDEFLLWRGLRLRPEWLESCAAGLPGFDGLGGAEAQARRCFEQFLFADMNTCGAGVLPEGVGSMHGALLDGPFVLQVDEIVNMSAPLRERYRGAHAGPKRCLKLSMTDGVQRIFGMEYRPIKDLEVLAPAGLKVVIRNVHIRRGLLMLVPEVIEILGGVVDDLEAARDRLVSEVNKPPRGKRKQGGLPLSSRATLAAWPGSANVTNDGEGISLPAAVNSSHPTGLGNAPQVGRTTGTVAAEFVSRPAMANIVQEQHLRVREINMQGLSTSRNNTGTFASIPRGHDGTQTVREEYVDPSIVVDNSHEQQRVQEVTMQEQATPCNRIQRSSTDTPFEYDSNRGPHAVGGTGLDDVEATQFSSPHAQEVKVQDLSSFRNNSETSASIPNGRDHAQTIEEEYVHTSIMATHSHKQATVSVRTERRSSSSTTTPCEYDPDHHSHAIGGTSENDVEAAQTSILDDEINHAEHSIILSGENEKPFTYIISMIADWGTRQDTETFIQGKIKGLISSVKSFRYRRCTEYELYVYIDDGSYISMALVDHNIVKNMIDLNPEEVTAALSGESMLVSTSEMKEILRGFQKFWVNCEGMMTIEFNKNSSLPIVRELTEGCSCSDAWLLRARLKTLYSRRHMQSLDDMDTTP